jgi:potassium channel subfamily K, other eukaryote
MLPFAKRSCSVLSAAVSLLVAGLLLTHRVLAFDKVHEHHRRKGTKFASGSDVRVYGRHFMLHVTFFITFLGISALVFSHIENWAYFDGIYFTVVSALTVGFGDFQPTTATGKAILFPVVVVLIAQLANIIGMIARFFKDRTQEVQDDWHRDFERTHQAEEDFRNPVPELEEELIFLQGVLRRVEMRRQLREIGASAITFLAFWLVGGAIFNRIEVSFDSDDQEISTQALGLVLRQ